MQILPWTKHKDKGLRLVCIADMIPPSPQTVQGELSDAAALSAVVAQSSSVVSLLGPSISASLDPSVFAGTYSALLPQMREHGVRRILAMATLSIKRPEDSFSLLRFLMVLAVRLLYPSAYRSIINIGAVFDGPEADASGVDWTLYRLGMVTGGDAEADWRADREKDAGVYAGWIGERGWSVGVTRGALARWLVDAVEGDADMWIGKMPAVSTHA